MICVVKDTVLALLCINVKHGDIQPKINLCVCVCVCSPGSFKCVLRFSDVLRFSQLSLTPQSQFIHTVCTLKLLLSPALSRTNMAKN